MQRVQRLANHLVNFNRSINSADASGQQQTERTISLGPREKTLGRDIDTLTDLNAIARDEQKREQFWSVGYGLFRNAIDRQLVLKAKDTIFQKTRQENQHHIFSDTKRGILSAHIQQDDLPFMEGKNDYTHHPNVLNVLENNGIANIMKVLLSCDQVQTFDYKWLRMVSPSKNTGVHVDNVYMSRGSNRLLTCWIPLMDIRIELGTVFVLDGSYHLPSFTHFQHTYGGMDAEAVNLNGTGHFTQDPDDMQQFFKNEQDYALRWKSCDFRAGDVLIFTKNTVHMSSVNMSQQNQVRMSCDTRWLSANEKADARFMYDPVTQKMGHEQGKKFGLYSVDDKKPVENSTEVTMQQLRSLWKI